MTRDALKRMIEARVFIRSDEKTKIVQKGGDSLKFAPWLFDFRAVTLDPGFLDAYAEDFWERYADNLPFQVGGLESAAISLVTAVVMKSIERGTPVNGFFIRKSRKRDGLMKQVEGVLNEHPVILVDDLINSGQTFDKQLKILDEAGKTVSDIFTILRFRELNAYDFLKKRNIDIKSLFSLEDFGIPLLLSDAAEVPRDTFKEVWRFKAANPSHELVVEKSTPLIDDSRVYCGGDDGIFRALDKKNGSVLWEFKTGKHPEGKGILSSPVLYQDTVFFGAYDGNVYALDASTGAMKWKNSDADWVGSSPAIAPTLGLLYIGLEFGLFRKKGGIAALSLGDGSLVWRHITPEHTHSSPLYIPQENLVVIGSNDGIAYGHDAKTGAVRFRFGTMADIKSSFAYDPKRRLILFGSMNGRFYALSARDGNPIFAREADAGIYSTPLVHGDTAFFASLDKCVYAIHLDTWKDRWTFETAGRIFASPVLFENSLWIGSNDGRLYELEPESGTLRAFFQITEKITSAIACDASTKRLFVATNGNDVYCIERMTVAY